MLYLWVFFHTCISCATQRLEGGGRSPETRITNSVSLHVLGIKTWFVGSTVIALNY